MVNLPTESSHCNDATCTTNDIPHHTCTSCSRHFCSHCVIEFSELSPFSNLSPLCNSCSLLSDSFVVHVSDPPEFTATVPRQPVTAARNLNNSNNLNNLVFLHSSPAATEATSAVNGEVTVAVVEAGAPPKGRSPQPKSSERMSRKLGRLPRISRLGSLLLIERGC